MLPNDPQLALYEANTAIEQRHREAAQERLAAGGRTATRHGTPGGPRATSRGFRGVTDRLRAALGGRVGVGPSRAHDIP